MSSRGRFSRALGLLMAVAFAAAATPPDLKSQLGSGWVPPESELIPLGTTQGQSYGRLVIRNATIVDGRGSPRANRGMPAQGPIDLVIENGIITDLRNVDPVVGRERATGDHVIDATGMYVLPGLVEMHAHLRSGPLLDYQYRLYLGHGVTTVRDAGTGGGLDVWASTVGDRR